MKRRKRSTISTMIQIMIAVVLFVLLLLLIFWYQDGLNSYKPEEKTFYYIEGVRMNCSEKAKFSRREDGLLEVKDGTDERTLDDTPIMFDAENKIVLTINNMVMRPAETVAQPFRLNAFTELSEKNGVVTAMFDGKSAKLESGFLYDGKNTYTFLETVKLQLGAKVIKLPALSYAKVGYRQYIEYYDSEAEDYLRVGIPDSDVTVTLQNGDVLDLGRDILTHDGQDNLLFSAVDLLQVLEME